MSKATYIETFKIVFLSFIFVQSVLELHIGIRRKIPDSVCVCVRLSVADQLQTNVDNMMENMPSCLYESTTGSISIHGNVFTYYVQYLILFTYTLGAMRIRRHCSMP